MDTLQTSFLDIAFDFHGVFSKNQRIFLRRPTPADRKPYLEIYRRRPNWKRIFKMRDFNATDMLWEAFCDSDTFNTVITNKYNGKFFGYCGLQYYTTTPEPELQIELLSEYQGQGIGYSALSLLMDHYAELTGTNHFLSRVYADNIASQKLMRKLGGIPNGVIKRAALSDAEAARLENETTPIDEESYARLAEEFGTTIQKLRSHALLFRFTR